MSDREYLSGRVAVVTGSGRNIGRAIALELARAGAAVVVNVRSSGAEAEAVADEIRRAGGRASVKIADVTDPDAVAALVETAEACRARCRGPRMRRGRSPASR